MCRPPDESGGFRKHQFNLIVRCYVKKKAEFLRECKELKMKSAGIFLCLGAIIGIAGMAFFRPKPVPPPVVKVEAPPPPQIGRYQIVEGKIERIELGTNCGKAELPVLLKIDTATGEVSRYTEMYVKRPDTGETVQIARFEKLQKPVTILEPEEQGKITK